VAAVLDHFSRYWIGFAVFRQRPTSADVCLFLDRAVRKAGTKPRPVISDKGKQFSCETYKAGCNGKRINPRFGAVGKKRSIAAVERFARSLESECARQIQVSPNVEAVRRELAYYAVWSNEYRPSQALAGRTPKEVQEDLPPANGLPRFEPRRKWLVSSPWAAPLTSINGKRRSRLALVLKLMEGRRHLPVVELQRAA